MPVRWPPTKLPGSSRVASGTSAAAAAAAPPVALAALSHAASLGQTASENLSRLSGGLIAAIMSVGLVLGGLAGWTRRSPDVMAVPFETASALPVLWVDPSWTAVPRQPTALAQFHAALFEAPYQERVAAFLAVPGRFPHAHDEVSKAYTQLARIWYRECNVDALEALESELSVWKSKKTHEEELVQVVRVAIKLRKTDFDGVLDGLKPLARDDVSEMYDPALVELSLEICSDALAATRAGTESIVRETLQQVQTHADQAALPDRSAQVEPAAVAGRGEAQLSH